MNGIKTMLNVYLVFEQMGGKSKCLIIVNFMRRGWIISPWLFEVYIDAVMKVKMGKGRIGVRFMEEERA